jgi:hypothetical protein
MPDEETSAIFYYIQVYVSVGCCRVMPIDLPRYKCFVTLWFLSYSKVQRTIRSIAG